MNAFENVMTEFNASQEITNSKVDELIEVLSQLKTRRCSLCGATRMENGTCTLIGCKDPLHDNREGM